MNPDALESLLQKARKMEPPPELKQRILQQVAVGQIPPPADSRSFRPSPAWSLIAAGWVLILALLNTTPNPLPNSPGAVAPPIAQPQLPLAITLTPESLAELSLALDSPQPFPTLLKLHSSH
jgi:hypothetical protein